ncbi:Six-hairpin glycosidase [Penicillium paradoxum]|uniref:Six-hairpin glycosidase n=1 Tax=Penicillium paradoxum TaxID=176176 RepID=UPI002547791D|nr:Six-hairpin glycosidase [Penicillium paradoxum]KAJ5779891.1 Six-hairpin glycosidase [Penicillium paradoxum]
MLMVNRQISAIAILAASVAAIDLDVNDEQSLKNAATIAAFNTMSNYTSNVTGNIPGKLNESWGEGGVLFQTMIQYWYLTGDASNNDAVSQGMYWQRGNDDYFPANYSQYSSNDDHMAWGLAAMTAAELGYPQDSSMPSWLTLAEAVFQLQSLRWDTESCNGGLRWQIWPYQDGYNKKGALSNGGLFQLSARLARYTNNQTYSDWAEKIWEWSTRVPLVNTTEWTIGDTVEVASDCKSHGDLSWTHNYGAYISGAAYMYNVTNGQSKWKSGVDGLLNTTFHKFFPDKYGGKIMVEISCEATRVCSRSQEIFKGLLASELAFVTRMVSYIASEILPRLQGSAIGAAKQCTGGPNGTLCGRRWYQSEWDGTADIEEQISATSLFTSNLVAFQHLNIATQKTSTSAQNTSSTATGTQSPTSTTPKVDSGTHRLRSPLGAVLALMVSISSLVWL